jgi:hypothetical protein
MSSMDPFDEFEFKPLTEGLGFHKKSVNLKDGLKNTGVLEAELQGLPLSVPKNMLEDAPKVSGKKHTFEDVLSALEKTPLNRSASQPALQFTEALPREKQGSPTAREKHQAMEPEMPQPLQSPFPLPSAYKGPSKKPAALNIPEARPSTGMRRGAADSPPRRLVPVSVSFASATLDAIIVFALALVFLIALLAVTKVDLAVVMNNLNKDRMTQISLGVLLIAVMQMYAIISRSFFGRTLGEWTFDMQLGQDKEQTSQSYPLRVTLRSLLNTLTGLVVLPLISLLMNRDLAGQLSGVQLYRQNV